MQVRYSAINLLRAGETIQVMKCDAPGSASCATPVSDPIAYGQVARGDVAAEPGTLVVRIVPTGADAPVPAQTLMILDLLAADLNPNPTMPATNPPVVVASPCWVRPHGEWLQLN